MYFIAVADDNKHYLKRNISFINSLNGFEICFATEDGLEFMLSLLRNKVVPDAVILDMNLPLIDGISLTLYLKIMHPEIKVIGISSFFENDLLKAFYGSGGDGFVFRGILENILPDCLQTVFKNERYYHESYELDPAEINKWESAYAHLELINEKYGITKRELALIILNASALSFDQIAKIMCVETKSVHVYFDRISKKLNTNSRQALTIFSLQFGLTRIGSFT